MPDPLRIVFFGTPDYAAPALRALASDPKFKLELVVTQPDRPAGRGRKLTPPPVKVAAETLGATVYQPDSLRTEATRAPLAAVQADLFIVAAYGIIFGPKALAMPQLGCVNLHASLLPNYRGASPISAAILHGDAITGVTLMRMEPGLDTGPMIAKAVCAIELTDTTESLTVKLAALGARLAVEAIPLLVEGSLIPEPQAEAGATLVRPLLKADGRIDWRQPAAALERLVRAMWPWPRAWFVLGDDLVQVHAASVTQSAGIEPGLVNLEDGGIAVTAGELAIWLDVVQFPGGKPMTGRQAAVSGRFVQGQVLPAPSEVANGVPMIRPVGSTSAER